MEIVFVILVLNLTKTYKQFCGREQMLNTGEGTRLSWFVKHKKSNGEMFRKFLENWKYVFYVFSSEMLLNCSSYTYL